MPKPSPWLNANQTPKPNPQASFVEYLRWLRFPHEEATKDGKKLELLQKALDSDYSRHLNRLTQRTRQLVKPDGQILELTCPWRIRVGGILGPEDILLPAFDALGIPFIPSSSLRGVARSQAIREIMRKQSISWTEAEKQIAPYFGDLEAKEEKDRCGKVIFFDAYPLPIVKIGKKNLALKSKGEKAIGGLSLDMANSIWTWQGNELGYKPNPNPFFSLKQATFVIGLRPRSGCDAQTLSQVKKWLEKGLAESGVGSQLNSGYGRLIKDVNDSKIAGEFFRVEFELEGQLIHGQQIFKDWKYKEKKQKWQPETKAEAEVRPTAFKSMLRYWFRTFALGKLSSKEVKKWEAKLFGAIDPQTLGWLRCYILDGEVERKEAGRSNDNYGLQSGILVLAYTSTMPEDKKKAVAKLIKHITWLMFHLGGVGQGARRPNYSRKNREKPPWWRGSTLISLSEEEFWEIPEKLKDFQKKFHFHLIAFYKALKNLTESNFILHKYRRAKEQTNSRENVDVNWSEAVDVNCRIVLCCGQPRNKKPYALAVLHSKNFKINGDYDPMLCGRVKPEPPFPSPVWIANLEKVGENEEDYQIVTIFGVREEPRSDFLQKLKEGTNKGHCLSLFPLPKPKK